MSLRICKSEDVGYWVRLPDEVRLNLKLQEAGLCLIGIEPVTLHTVHLSETGEFPLCGTPSLTGFEVTGDVKTDGAWHLNSCRRCLKIAQGLFVQTG